MASFKLFFLTCVVASASAAGKDWGIIDAMSKCNFPNSFMARGCSNVVMISTKLKIPHPTREESAAAFHSAMGDPAAPVFWARWYTGQYDDFQFDEDGSFKIPAPGMDVTVRGVDHDSANHCTKFSMALSSPEYFPAGVRMHVDVVDFLHDDEDDGPVVFTGVLDLMKELTDDKKSTTTIGSGSRRGGGGGSVKNGDGGLGLSLPSGLDNGNNVLEDIDEDDDDSNGYHSDSESCVMTSGNSPFISKEARYNFLTRSVRLGSKHNVRASILATCSSSASLCLDTASLRSTGPGSIFGGSIAGGSVKNLVLSSGLSVAKAANADPAVGKDGGGSGGEDKNGNNSNNHNSSSGVSSGSSSDNDHDHVSSAAAGKDVRAASRQSAKLRGKDKGSSKSDKHHMDDSTESSSSNEPIYQGIVERDISVIRKEAEIETLKADLSTLKNELTQNQRLLFAVEDSEKDLREKLTQERQRSLALEKVIQQKRTAATAAVVTGAHAQKEAAAGRADQDTSRSSSDLVRRYGELYSQVRLETLDALDRMPELVNSEELKNKLLFSVVVLAFRSVTTSIESKRDQIRRILQLPPPPASASSEDVASSSDPASQTSEAAAASDLEEAVSSYLRRATENFDLTKNVEEVLSQIWATLYDYPCLKSCDGIVAYVKECTRVAWGLTNQVPAFVVEYETRQFSPSLHVRFHSSAQDGAVIQTYLWPALLEGRGGQCVQKGVVIT